MEGRSGKLLTTARWPVAVSAFAVLAAAVHPAFTPSAFPTREEAAELAYGVAIWRAASAPCDWGRPPLAAAVAALPVVVFLPPAPPAAGADEPPEGGSRGAAAFASANALEYLRMAAVARSTGVLWLTLGAVVIYHWGRELFGPLGAAAATALWAFHPGVLAHSHLADSPLPATVCGVTAAYAGWHWAERGTWVAAAAWGGLLGVVALAFPLALVLLPVWVIWTSMQRGADGEQLGQGLAAGLLGLLLADVGYRLAGSPQGIFTSLDPQTDQAGPPCPLALAVLVKCPLGLLVLGAWGLLAGPGGRCRLYVPAVLIPALALVGAAGMDRTARIDGALLVSPYLALMAGAACGSARGPRTVMAGGLLVASLAAGIWAWPHPMGYASGLAAISPSARRWAEWDADRGQDVLALKRWADTHTDARPLWVAVRHPVDYRFIGLEFPAPFANPTATIRLPLGPVPTSGDLRPGYYALDGHSLTDPGYTYLSRFTPIAVAGNTVKIFRLSVLELNAVRIEFGLPQLLDVTPDPK